VESARRLFPPFIQTLFRRNCPKSLNHPPAISSILVYEKTDSGFDSTPRNRDGGECRRAACEHRDCNPCSRASRGCASASRRGAAACLCAAPGSCGARSRSACTQGSCRFSPMDSRRVCSPAAGCRCHTGAPRLRSGSRKLARPYRVGTPLRLGPLPVATFCIVRSRGPVASRQPAFSFRFTPDSRP